MTTTLQKDWNLFVKGDNQSLSSIYETYYATLILTAYYYIKDEEKSKEVVSDVFVKLLNYSLQKRKDNLADVSEKIETFLKVVVKNKCFDNLKVEKNRKGILNGIYNLSSRSINKDSFLQKDFEKIIDLLPNRQKEVLSLHIAGFDNHEISSQLGITYNTTKNTLSTSKKKIKNLWKHFMI
ncbi:MAG: sigma-70 family RNA polymerase sigma factor [Flavobacteriaceae bacterium]|nr:sigma-70 family RNA polymerase sigma factor [Flavobacteriaceae bacterium]